MAASIARTARQILGLACLALVAWALSAPMPRASTHSLDIGEGRDSASLAMFSWGEAIADYLRLDGHAALIERGGAEYAAVGASAGFGTDYLSAGFGASYFPRIPDRLATPWNFLLSLRGDFKWPRNKVYLFLLHWSNGDKVIGRQGSRTNQGEDFIGIGIGF